MNRPAFSAVACLFAIGVTASSAPGQTVPDFSGRWVRDSAANAGAPTMGSGWGPDLTIRQDPARLTVEYAFFARSDMQAPIRLVYPLDGTESKNSLMMGRGFQELRSKTAWTGAALVITTEQTIPDPTGSGEPLRTEMKQALSLVSPTSLVIETTRSGALGGATSTTRTTYRRM
jgi:hypothetical protein